ncbi:hypothetical protein DL764_006642 [Monosporascus ibericus]|uniref:Bacteriophage T5 Orf172 DNA-binding domain-containing protein n=1 Tax=Monosporascus ibericus TaxID=155417 RepID=A0A4Q4T4A6_9PEZI|nr:hypothetical protein DL764_006642 [Monosporascus ibericus]
MITNDTTSEHPVFKELITILRAIDICPNPEDWEFTHCPALAKSTTKPCQKSLKYGENAERLCSHFRVMKECPETDEFFDQLEEFLTVSHCFWHGRKAIENLEKWKKIRATTVPSSADPPPTISDDDHDGTSKSLHAAATTQPMDPVFGKAKRPELTSETNRTASVHVETVTHGISTMAITAAGQIDVVDNHGNANVATAEQIFGLGLTSLQRKGSLRNHAPVFSEIHKPLTPVQKEYGIVYVLEHKIEKGLFKIGWTRATAEERLNQAGNCSAPNAEILHQTRGGPFFAASKAEKLAQTVLRHHNLTITKCEQCGGGHREWFRAPRKMVVETVEIMETFVRLPAYESKNGQTWKLSDAAYEMIRTMCEFSTSRLRNAITTIERHSIDKPPGGLSTQLKPEAASHVAETAIPPRPPDSDQSMEGKKLSAATEAVDCGKGAKGATRSVGADAARQAKRVVRKAGEFKDRMGQIWNRPREGTPELDGDDKTENFGTGNKSGSGTGDVQDAVIGVFWSLFPEDITIRKSNINNKESHGGVSWVKTVKHEFRDIITDFQVEWKREEECRECPASMESK